MTWDPRLSEGFEVFLTCPPKPGPRCGTSSTIPAGGLFRWKQQYGGREEGATRLKPLEKENSRLKPLIADQNHRNQILKRVPLRIPSIDHLTPELRLSRSRVQERALGCNGDKPSRRERLAVQQCAIVLVVASAKSPCHNALAHRPPSARGLTAGASCAT